MVGGPDDAAGIQQQQNSLGELGGWDPVSSLQRILLEVEMQISDLLLAFAPHVRFSNPTTSTSQYDCCVLLLDPEPY